MSQQDHVDNDSYLVDKDKDKDKDSYLYYKPGTVPNALQYYLPQP